MRNGYRCGNILREQRASLEMILKGTREDLGDVQCGLLWVVDIYLVSGDA